MTQIGPFARHMLAYAQAKAALALPRIEMEVRPTVSLICVYRNRNAANVIKLLEANSPSIDHIALWALDKADDRLASHTVGVGAGARNRLMSHLERAAPRHDYLLILEDDIELVVGDLHDLISISTVANFALSQATHSWDSNCTFRYARGLISRTARQTQFADVGPMVLLRRELREVLFPMNPPDSMGWAASVEWCAARGSRKYGLVDAVQIRHFGVIASEYSRKVESDLQRDTVARLNTGKIDDFLVTENTWYAWQKKPVWATEAVSIPSHALAHAFGLRSSDQSQSD